MANGKIHYGVGLDNSQLRQGAEESKNILRGIGKTAVQEGDNIDNTFKNVGKTIAGVFALQQVKEFAVQVAKVRGEFQQLEVAFKTLLGSSTKADILMSQLIETAATTPFGMTEIAQGAKQLIAYGTASEDVNETLIRLGDIAAGLSLPIGDLAYLYGTTMVQGRLYTQDLNQFLGRGIPLMEELAKQFGVTKAEVKGLVEEGKVGFPQVQEAIWNLTNEGSKFGGLMEAQSHTITGQISNIEDAIDQMYNELGQKSEGIINVVLSGTSTVIENWETIGKTLLVVISTYGAYKAAVLAVAAAHKMAAIWGEVTAFLSLAKSVKTAKDAMILLNIATKANPIGLVLGVVAAAATAFMLFSDSTDEATEALKREREEAEEFNKRVSSSAGKAMSAYKQLQKEYKDCKTAHEKREWIKNSQQRFSELGIAVNSVNTAENVFVKNTQLMMEAFKKRAEASAWQAKLDEEYAKLVNRKLELEQKRDKITAGSVVAGSSHTTKGGNEYVNSAGQWVYTEQGAQKARAQIANSINGDPVLNEIQSRIDTYAAKVTEVSDGMNKLFKDAGNDPKKSKKELNSEETAAEKARKEAQKLADETAERNKQIRENDKKTAEQSAQGALDIEQARINTLDEGYARELAQNQLNWERLKAQNAKRQQEMLDDLKDKKVLEWQNANPKATKEQTLEYEKSLKLTVADLSEEQRNQLDAYGKYAEDMWKEANKNSLDKMLGDVLTYEQKRTKVAEEYSKKRKQLYETNAQGEYVTDAQGNKKLRAGVTQGNVDELNESERTALSAIDEQFASKSDEYEAWCNAISELTLKQLEAVLKDAQKKLDELEQSGNAPEKDLANARAKVTKAQSQLSKTKSANDVSPKKRSVKEWEDLYKTLNDCEKEFENVGDAVGGVAGEIIKTAGTIMSSTLQMINGIVQLVNMSAIGMQGTSVAAATAISTIEKASVILTVISAALQIAMTIVNLFNNDDDKQEEIDNLQDRIDQLQWELDHQDIAQLEKNSFDSLIKIRNVMAELRQELIDNAKATGNLWAIILAGSRKISDQQDVLQRGAQKIADAYANIAYTADKALGEDKYANAKEQLENIAQQQIMLQEQIKAENSKKDTDNGAIKDWENKIKELGEEAITIINDMVEEIIGGSSSEISEQLSDAFFEAFANGEDYAKAWGDKVNEIVADIMKKMLVQKFLEEPLGEIFNKYKSQWFKNGTFQGLQSVIDSMGSFANDLNGLYPMFSEGVQAILNTLPDNLTNLFVGEVEDSREAAEKGIATASQESVDELNGRATTIQGHTFSISENTKILVQNTGLILQSVLQIEDNTDGLSSRMANVETNIKVVKDTISEIALNGIKLK